MDICTRTSCHGSGEEIDCFYRCRLWKGYGGREFNCINGICAMPVTSEPEKRPCSTDNTRILPLLHVATQEYCANRSMKEESIQQIAQNSFLSGKSLLYLLGISLSMLDITHEMF